MPVLFLYGRNTMTDAYIGLGSNLGDSPSNLKLAAGAIGALPDIHVNALSSIFCTEPQGKKEQPWFYNAVLKIQCGERWRPHTLLQKLLEIETHLGRTRDPSDRFGPRIIDIDLLLFGNESMREQSNPPLELPHPRLHERAFVLVPLHEIAPGLILPDGHAVCALLEALPHRVENNRIYQ